MNNFTQRAITGAGIVVVLLGSIILSEYSFYALFLLITVLGVWEFYSLIEKAGYFPQKYFGTLIASFLFINVVLTTAFHFDTIGFLFVFPMIFMIMIFELFTKSEKPFINIAVTILGIFYVAVSFSFLILIANVPLIIGKVAYSGYSPHILLGMIYMIWANDTGAYIIGSKFGKHKLFERISPNKTWEGSFGGAVFALLVAYLISIFYTDINLMDWFAISLIAIVMGTLGDLVKSLLKRSLNIKDSGTILPGHGGILDRFDSIIMAAPFVLLYIVLRFHQ